MIRRLRPLLPALGAFLLLGSPATAGEVASPALVPGTMDLLPLDDLQMADFQRENAVLVSRVRGLGYRVAKLQKQLQGRRGKDRRDAATRKLEYDLRGLRAQQAALMVRVTEQLAPYGVDGPLVAYMNRAAAGPRRIERYAQGLVLLAPDLTPTQCGLFERVVAQLEGAFYALEAQKDRLALALEQSQLDPADQKALLGTFQRQTRLSDQRFWQLVDGTLTREQRAWIWRRLPQRLKRKSQPVEHLFALPGLTPSQATRLKALLTEIEQESAPDDAALKRIAAATKGEARRHSGEERAALDRERGEAWKRLTDLRRYGAQATRDILTDEQWLAYEAIPPQVSVNDRRMGFRRLFQGFEPRPEQAERIRALTREAAREQREVNQRVKALQAAGADYGPDSPQMTMMQMQMANMAAEGHRAQREQMGRILLEVLTPDQVGRWVMGHWGYKR